MEWCHQGNLRDEAVDAINLKKCTCICFLETSTSKHNFAAKNCVFLFWISNIHRSPGDRRGKTFLPLLSDYLRTGKPLNTVQNMIFMNVNFVVIAGAIWTLPGLPDSGKALGSQQQQNLKTHGLLSFLPTWSPGLPLSIPLFFLGVQGLPLPHAHGPISQRQWRVLSITFFLLDLTHNPCLHWVLPAGCLHKG